MKPLKQKIFKLAKQTAERSIGKSVPALIHEPKVPKSLCLVLKKK